MAEIFAVVSTALYVLCWPFIKLLQAVSFVLAPFWAATQFVLLPITYAVHAVLSIALFPFRLHVLDRIEAIYVYLGVAALIGCLAGTVLHFSFGFLSSTLSIDAASESRGRTTAEYRAARSRRKTGSLEHASSPTTPKPGSGSRRQRGLLSQTIVEEEDSDF